jgi:outer membrane receptor protein involved in Fe transport
VVAADPINNVLRNALPNINTTGNDINNALNLYALLTGRITSVSVATQVDEETHKYIQFAETMQRYAFTTFGLYAQDSFRIRPDLTLNFGLRWQFDGDILQRQRSAFATERRQLPGPIHSSVPTGRRKRQP